MNTIVRARGRWQQILPKLGVDPRYLVNRHGPCPLCGGRDRFRFDDKDGSGSYFCGQCGAGAGLILLQKLNGWDFKTAADEVDKVLGDTAPVELSAKMSNKSQRSLTPRIGWPGCNGYSTAPEIVAWSTAI